MRLDSPSDPMDPESPTEAQKLENVWEQVGGEPWTKPEELDRVELPAEGQRVWEVFLRVQGAEPLTWTELRSFVEMSGEALEPWESEALLAMDRSMRDEQRKLLKRGSGGGVDA